MTDEFNSTQVSAQPTRSKRAFRLGLLLTCLGLVVFISVYSYGYFQLARINTVLATLINQMQGDSIKQADLIQALSTRQAELENIANNVNARLSAQEKVLNELSALKKQDQTQWAVGEAEYLLRLANQRLALSEDPSTALPLLEKASNLLSTLTSPSLTPLRSALTDAIQRLSKAASVDKTQVYSQLMQLEQAIDNLSLPFAPLAANPVATGDNTEPEGVWWRRGLNHSLAVLKQVVVVKRMDGANLPVIMPDEKAYFYLNLHAQVEDMIWGLLHQDQTVYDKSINRLQHWINTYFDQNAPATQQALSLLTELAKVKVQPDRVDLSPVLQQFADYRKQAMTPASANP